MEKAFKKSVLFRLIRVPKVLITAILKEPKKWDTRQGKIKAR